MCSSFVPAAGGNPFSCYIFVFGTAEKATCATTTDTVITLPASQRGTYIAHLVIKKLCIFPTVCVCVFLVVL
jgi:hypothetical protein